jgi:hypothetical protein
MRILSIAIALVAVTPALAESQEACLARWKAADLDANGSYQANLDNADYASALANKAEISRDEFLSLCKEDRFANIRVPDNPAASRDFGKGDLTPGPAMKKEDAAKKLKSLGYGDVTDLALDEKGIWRGTAVVNGEKKQVAIDPQGDVLSN